VKHSTQHRKPKALCPRGSLVCSYRRGPLSPGPPLPQEGPPTAAQCGHTPRCAPYRSRAHTPVCALWGSRAGREGIPSRAGKKGSQLWLTRGVGSGSARPTRWLWLPSPPLPPPHSTPRAVTRARTAQTRMKRPPRAWRPLPSWGVDNCHSTWANVTVPGGAGTGEGLEASLRFSSRPHSDSCS